MRFSKCYEDGQRQHFDLVKSQENCKFQCLRFSKSYACLRNKECYECRKLEHRELLESYEGMFQIRVFAALGRVSILQITIISQIKHIATSQNTLQHTSIRGVQEDICVVIFVHVLQIGGGLRPPQPLRYFVMQARCSKKNKL